MLRSPIFWLMYLMFIGVSASGLMATAQLGPIAKDFNISNTVIFMGANTLSVALVVDNLLNGLARPFFGGLSDQIGRERTMALAFRLGAVSYWLLAVAGHTPWAFVTGPWESVFLVAAATNAVVVLLAVFVLRSVRANQMRHARISGDAPGVSGG